ncbi:MAG: VWA domain-containing protein [Nitrososphaera sp.]|nr:VWA domain-containing protein [Nitrososphaera sp.]
MFTWICAALLTFAGPTGHDAPTTRRVTIPGAQVQINQIETSQFPKVVIFATVLKDDVPVPGLIDQDFRVREDEVDQEPLTVVPKLTPLSVVLTLDTSGSMKKRLADAQVAAKSFLTMLQSQDKVQVIRFARDVKTIYPLGADRRAAEVAIDGTVARGDTALWDALYVSVESLREVAGRKAIILLSDGVDDDGTGKPLSKRSVADVLALASQVNVPIYAIGLGTELDELALKKVAGQSGALYLNAIDTSGLTGLYVSIGKQLTGQYTIYYTSSLPADGSVHRVQLKFGDNTSISYLPASTTVAKATTTPALESPAKAPLPVENELTLLLTKVDWLNVIAGLVLTAVFLSSTPWWFQILRNVFNDRYRTYYGEYYTYNWAIKGGREISEKTLIISRNWMGLPNAELFIKEYVTLTYHGRMRADRRSLYFDLIGKGHAEELKLVFHEPLEKKINLLIGVFAAVTLDADPVCGKLVISQKRLSNDGAQQLLGRPSVIIVDSKHQRNITADPIDITDVINSKFT